MIIAEFIEWIFQSPFIWMALLGVVSANSIRKHNIWSSLPYAPLLDEKRNSTSSQLFPAFAAGTLAAVLLFYTDGIPDMAAAVGIWFIAGIMMITKNESIAFLAACFAISIFTYFIGNIDLTYKIIKYGAAYQLVLGILYLAGKKQTQPIMIQDKTGRIFGEHIYSRVWLFPAVVFSIINSAIENIAYIMIVMILFSDIRINRESVKSYFKKRGIFMTAASAVLLGLSYINNELILSIMILGILPLTIIIWFIAMHIFKKNNDYIYTANDKGVQILYIYESDESPANQMGLEIGDLICKINGRRVIRQEAISVVLEEYPPFVWLEIVRDDKTIETEYKDYENGINTLGVVYTPRNPTKFEVYFESRLSKNIKKRLKSIFKH